MNQSHKEMKIHLESVGRTLSEAQRAAQRLEVRSHFPALPVASLVLQLAVGGSEMVFANLTTAKSPLRFLLMTVFF